MRVPVSIVVRMKSASNMIAKWYQYASSVLIPGRPAEDARHADGERHAASGARGDDLVGLARQRGQLLHLDARGARSRRRRAWSRARRRRRRGSRARRASGWRARARSTPGSPSCRRATAMGSPSFSPRSSRSCGVRTASSRASSSARRARALRRASASLATIATCGFGVDRDVVLVRHRARGDERGDADEPLDEHRAVADGAAVALLVDHLRASCRWRRARGSR